MRDLAKVRIDYEQRTCCLTCPPEDPGPEAFYDAFRLFKRWFAKRWSDYGVHWKMEPQKRGAMHAHLLLYIPPEFVDKGCDHNHEREPHWSIAQKWYDLIGGGNYDHFIFHQDPRNWQKVRAGMVGYFSKYIGKKEDCEGVQAKGHWWGRINKSSIPYGEEKEFTPPEEVLTKVHRWCRKLRQRKAELGHKRAIERALFGKDALEIPWWKACSRTLPNSEDGVAVLTRLVRSKGLTWTRPKLPKTGSVFLIGTSAPQNIAQMALHAAELCGLSTQEGNPTGFQQRKPIPPPTSEGVAGRAE